MKLKGKKVFKILLLLVSIYSICLGAQPITNPVGKTTTKLELTPLGGIDRAINNGTISIGHSSLESGMYAEGSGKKLENNGEIISDDTTKNIGMVAKSGASAINEANGSIKNHGIGMSGTYDDNAPVKIWKLENKGLIENTDDTGIYGDGEGSIINSGTITNNGNYGIHSVGNSSILNSGTITNNGKSGILGDDTLNFTKQISNESIINTGKVINNGDYGIHIKDGFNTINNGTIENTGKSGIYGDGTGAIKNNTSGTINVSNGIGIYETGSGKVINDGRINVTKGTGIKVKNGNLINSGRVDANNQIAIEMDGKDSVLELKSGTQITGKVDGLKGEDILVLSGNGRVDVGNDPVVGFEKLVATGDITARGVYDLGVSNKSNYTNSAFNGKSYSINDVSGATGNLTVDGTINVGVDYDGITAHGTDKTGKIVAQTITIGKNGNINLRNGGSSKNTIVNEIFKNDPTATKFRIKGVATIKDGGTSVVSPSFFSTDKNTGGNFEWKSMTIGDRIGNNGSRLLDQKYFKVISTDVVNKEIELLTQGKERDIEALIKNSEDELIRMSNQRTIMRNQEIARKNEIIARRDEVITKAIKAAEDMRKLIEDKNKELSTVKGQLTTNQQLAENQRLSIIAAKDQEMRDDIKLRRAELASEKALEAKTVAEKDQIIEEQERKLALDKALGIKKIVGRNKMIQEQEKKLATEIALGSRTVAEKDQMIQEQKRKLALDKALEVKKTTGRNRIIQEQEKKLATEKALGSRIVLEKDQTIEEQKNTDIKIIAEKNQVIQEKERVIAEGIARVKELKALLESNRKIQDEAPLVNKMENQPKLIETNRKIEIKNQEIAKIIEDYEAQIKQEKIEEAILIEQNKMLEEKEIAEVVTRDKLLALKALIEEEKRKNQERVANINIPRNKVDVDSMNRLTKLSGNMTSLDFKTLEKGQSKFALSYIGSKSNSSFKKTGAYNYDYDVNNNGEILGYMYQVSPNLSLGTAFSHEEGSIKYNDEYLLNEKGQKVIQKTNPGDNHTENMRIFNGQIFGKYEINNFNLSTGIAYGRSKHEMSTHFVRGMEHGKYDSNVLKTGAEGSYNYKLGQKLELVPSVGMDYLSVKEGKIKYDNGLELNSANAHGLIGKLGIKLRDRHGKFRWSLGTSYKLRSRDSFHETRKVSGLPLEEAKLVVGKGTLFVDGNIEYDILANLALKLGYEYEKNINYTTNNIDAGFSYKF